MASAPQITYKVVDNNLLTRSLTGHESILVKGHSFAGAEMSVYSPDGTAIKTGTARIRNGDKTVYGYQGSFPGITDNVFTFSVADEFGNVGTAKYTAPMVDYEDPTCVLSNNRPDGSGNMTVSCSGTWFNDTFGQVTNIHNSLTVSYRYVELGQDISYATWNDMTVYTSGNAYSASADLSGLDYQKAYFFEVVARDLLSQGRDTSQGVTGAPVFHWSNDDVTFEVPVTFNKGINGVQYSEWTPHLYGEEYYVYDSREGWAFKIGNIATVGFYIKAQYFSYTLSPIVIYGCPYYPTQASAGGGMCSGAVVSEGKTFQCFVAENSQDYGDKVITTRVQDCDRPTQTELRTYASGCFSPFHTGVLTISGTITYLT